MSGSYQALQAQLNQILQLVQNIISVGYARLNVNQFWSATQDFTGSILVCADPVINSKGKYDPNSVVNVNFLTENTNHNLTLTTLNLGINGTSETRGVDGSIQAPEPTLSSSPPSLNIGTGYEYTILTNPFIIGASCQMNSVLLDVNGNQGENGFVLSSQDGNIEWLNLATNYARLPADNTFTVNKDSIAIEPSTQSIKLFNKDTPTITSIYGLNTLSSTHEVDADEYNYHHQNYSITDTTMTLTNNLQMGDATAFTQTTTRMLIQESGTQANYSQVEISPLGNVTTQWDNYINKDLYLHSYTEIPASNEQHTFQVIQPTIEKNPLIVSLIDTFQYEEVQIHSLILSSSTIEMNRAVDGEQIQLQLKIEGLNASNAPLIIGNTTNEIRIGHSEGDYPTSRTTLYGKILDSTNQEGTNQQLLMSDANGQLIWNDTVYVKASSIPSNLFAGLTNSLGLNSYGEYQQEDVVWTTLSVPSSWKSDITTASPISSSNGWKFQRTATAGSSIQWSMYNPTYGQSALPLTLDFPPILKSSLQSAWFIVQTDIALTAQSTLYMGIYTYDFNQPPASPLFYTTRHTYHLNTQDLPDSTTAFSTKTGFRYLFYCCDSNPMVANPANPNTITVGNGQSSQRSMKLGDPFNIYTDVPHVKMNAVSYAFNTPYNPLTAPDLPIVGINIFSNNGTINNGIDITIQSCGYSDGTFTNSYDYFLRYS